MNNTRDRDRSMSDCREPLETDGGREGRTPEGGIGEREDAQAARREISGSGVPLPFCILLLPSMPGLQKRVSV